MRIVFGGHPRTPGSVFGGHPRTPGLRSTLISVALAAALLAAGCGSASATAATVNGRDISRKEFDREIKALVENQELMKLSGGGQGLIGKGKDTADARFTAQWLTAVIYDALITDEFEKRKLKITKEDEATAAGQLAEQFDNPKVVDAFPEWFRDRLSGRNARAVALRTALTGVSQSEADLRKYYDEHKDTFVQVCLSHILVKSSKDAADAVLARIKGGEDFAAVAKAVSEDPGSAEQGGDLGCNFAGLFVKEFADAAVSAPIGTPTDPVQTQFGFHILLVKDRPAAPFESVRSQVKTNLNNESQAKFREFLVKAAQDAKVTVDPRYGTFKADSESGSPEVVPPDTPAPAEGRPETTEPTGPAGVPGLDEMPADTSPSTTAP